MTHLSNSLRLQLTIRHCLLAFNKILWGFIWFGLVWCCNFVDSISKLPPISKHVASVPLLAKVPILNTIQVTTFLTILSVVKVFKVNEFWYLLTPVFVIVWMNTSWHEVTDQFFHNFDKVPKLLLKLCFHRYKHISSSLSSLRSPDLLRPFCNYFGVVANYLGKQGLQWSIFFLIFV